MQYFKNAWRTGWLLGIVALLAACSSLTLNEHEQADRARIEAYAGAPVDHFTWLGRDGGWKALSQDEALIWMSPANAYLIQVTPPCADLRHASRIGLTSTLGTVYSRGLDYVKVRGWRCAIKEVRPVDYARLQADLRRERQMQHARTEDASREPRNSG